jgi:hypothetical protein
MYEFQAFSDVHDGKIAKRKKKRHKFQEARELGETSNELFGVSFYSPPSTNTEN